MNLDTSTRRHGRTTADRPRSRRPARRRHRRPWRRLAVFLVATLTTTWLAFLPMIIGLVDRTSSAGFCLLLLGIGAPSITAFVLSGARTAGPE